MGYNTDFIGSFKLNKKLDNKMSAFLFEFNEIRHNGNSKYKGTPGDWCQWAPSSDNLAIEWNEEEKFYNYIEWIEYLVVNFLNPKGYVLNGEVEWHGEDFDDRGKISIINNAVTAKYAQTTYEDVDALLKENKQLKNDLAEALLLGSKHE